MDEKALHARVDQRGWNPDSPNDACREAITRPPLLERLTREDADGCHFLTVYLEYDRLLEAMGIGDDDGHAYALSVATYVVLRHHEAIPNSQEEFTERAKEFQRWNDRVMDPAGERLRVAKHEEGRDNEWLLRNREQFEPVITMILVHNNRFFPADVTADRVGMARGLIMHEEGRMYVATPPAPMDEQLFFNYFQWLAGPKRSVSKYGPDGLLRLESLKVKDAFDSEFGKVRRSKRERLSPDAGRKLVDSATPLESAQESDLMDAARAVAAASELKGREKKAADAIRDHLPALLDGSLSRRQLAIRAKVSRQAIDAAWEIFRQRVARNIG